MKDMKHQGKMPMASDAGQCPPTESNPTRQHYQMACPGMGSGAGVSRQRTSSRQFNRGSGGGSSGKRSRGY